MRIPSKVGHPATIAEIFYWIAWALVVVPASLIFGMLAIFKRKKP